MGINAFPAKEGARPVSHDRATRAMGAQPLKASPMLLDQSRRRYEASRRLPPLACGHRDPERADGSQPVTRPRDDLETDAAAAALIHLAAVGCPGLLDLETCRAIWRRGYRDVAMDCARRATGAL